MKKNGPPFSHSEPRVSDFPFPSPSGKDPSESKEPFMRIQNAKVDFIQRPFLRPVKIAADTFDTFESVILTLESECGTGQAEITNTLLPDLDLAYLAETFRQHIIPLLANVSVSDTASLRQLLGKWSRDPTIYALCEIAWYALRADEKKESLAQTLGGSPVSQQLFTVMDEPEMDADGYPNANVFLDRVKALYEAGYVHLELKIRPGWDVAMVRSVRQENPDASFHLDLEGALGPAHYDILFQLRDFFPFMIEQPFAADQLVEDAEFQKMIDFPLCLDESVVSPGMVLSAVRLGSMKIVKINPVRVGGFENAKEILSICREEGIDCWISSPISTGVGVRANLALSSLDGFTGPFEYHDLHDIFAPEHLEGLELPPEVTLDENKTLRIE